MAVFHVGLVDLDRWRWGYTTGWKGHAWFHCGAVRSSGMGLMRVKSTGQVRR
jgi:hypothetical protein